MSLKSTSLLSCCEQEESGVVHELGSAAFSLAVVLATEPALITIEVSAQTIRRIVAIDLWYGIVASAAVISGNAGDLGGEGREEIG